MTYMEARLPVDSTSAAGAMHTRRTRERVLIVGCMLAGLGTSTVAAGSPDVVPRMQYFIGQTTAGDMVRAAQPIGTAIAELRRLSGLTWEQLARLFGVSRRSLHFWASGKPMAASNENHLQRVLAVLRRIDRGAASANRSLLLGELEDGTVPFDLLVNADYERAVSVLGGGEARPVVPPKISAASRAARAPRPPEELVGALQGRAHPTSGRLLAARPVVTSRRP